MAKRAKPGFTLLEALVALIIFGIISYATGSALTAALRAHAAAQRRHENSATVRVIFDALSRDIHAAYGATGDPNSLFVYGTPNQAGNSSNSTNRLLTLSAQSQRIQAEGLDPQQSNGANSANRGAGPPQSDCVMVRYDLDTQHGTLSRAIETVPNRQALEQLTPGPEAVLATRVVSLSLQFWDTNANGWRSDWDFEPQPPQTTTGSGGAGTNGTGTGTTGGTGATGAGANSGASTNATPVSRDSTLPAFVKVDLVLQTPDDTQAHYVTTLPVTSTVRVDPNASAQNSGGQNGQNTGSNAQGGQ